MLSSVTHPRHIPTPIAFGFFFDYFYKVLIIWREKMALKRKIKLAMLFWLASAPLLGGTGRPSDGFLSFVLLLGFLLVILGILQLAAYLKRKIRDMLEGLY
jgi:hypothetical protein